MPLRNRIYFHSFAFPLKHNKEPGKSVCDANFPGINVQHNFQMLCERERGKTKISGYGKRNAALGVYQEEVD